MDGQDYLERMNLESVATCPFVYKELSSRRVLTLEKFDGVPLTDLEAIKQVHKMRVCEKHAVPDPQPSPVSCRLLGQQNRWVHRIASRANSPCGVLLGKRVWQPQLADAHVYRGSSRWRRTATQRPRSSPRSTPGASRRQAFAWLCLSYTPLVEKLE